LNYLEEYSQHYDSVEIDQWFWSLHGKDRVSLPRSDVVEAYLKSVPDDFKFTIKIPNSITLTHFYRKRKEDPLIQNPYFLSTGLFEVFLKSIRPLESHLGPLMFQFEYLNKQKMATQAEFQDRFQTFISQCPREYRYAMEIRNPNYLNDAYFNFLNQSELFHVFLEGYYMPPITKVFHEHSTAIQGATVIRLHGPDRKRIEEKTKGQWDQIVEPREEALDTIVDMIHNLHTSHVDVWLNVNNHFEGSAPLSIQRIQNRFDNDKKYQTGDDS